VSAGSNSITVSGMNNQSEIYAPTGNKGVGITVIYNDGTPSIRAGYVDGQDYVWSGFQPPYSVTEPQTFTFAAKNAERAAALGILAGEAIGPTQTGVQSSVISGEFDTGETFALVNALASKKGFELDAENFPVMVPAGAKSLKVEIISGGGDQPVSLQWLTGSLTIESGATPPPVDECKPNTYRWSLWVLWWKQHLRHKFGPKYASKYDKYFDACTSRACRSRTTGARRRGPSSISSASTRTTATGGASNRSCLPGPAV